MVPSVLALTIANLVIGIAGTFPNDNKPSKWVIVVFVFIWYLTTYSV
jgi:hypothetical protein